MLVNTRNRALEAARKLPGGSTRAIAKLIASDESTANYHLRQLKRKGLVEAVRAGRELVWYPRNCAFCPVLQRTVPLFRRAGFGQVARALGDEPRTAVEVAGASGVHIGSVRWNLPLLQEAGIAERTSVRGVRLRQGAERCISKATNAEPCGEWGHCPVSRSLGFGVVVPPSLRARRADAHHRVGRVPAERARHDENRADHERHGQRDGGPIGRERHG